MSGLYNLRTTDKGWQVTKFDEDFNVESSYEMTQDDELRCGCPAGARPSCRHREMFAFLIPRVDSAWFLNHDTFGWVDPTGEAALSKPEPEPHLEKALNTIMAEGFTEPAPVVRQPDSHPFRRRM